MGTRLRLRDLDEASLIAHIGSFFGKTQRPKPVLGIGDDGALLAVRQGHHLVVTSDAAVEGVDFVCGRFPWDAIGHRVLAQNLSDLAAMGARPLGFILNLIASPGLQLAHLNPLLGAMAELADSVQCPLVGGDLSSTEGPLTLDITALGEVPRGQELRRSGARKGDRLWVTGSLGGAALGLDRVLSSKRRLGASTQTVLGQCGQDAAAQLEALLLPQPRLSFGRFLRAHATSCIDISDGLARDVHRLADASGVAVELDPERLPLCSGASWRQALASGEEFELLFTAEESASTAIRRAGRRYALATTEIGQVCAGSGVRLASGEALPPAGFDHFWAGQGTGIAIRLRQACHRFFPRLFCR